MLISQYMRRFFSIGPFLMELINPPPRETLTMTQKGGRVVLVTVTLVTLCTISALIMALTFFVVQRSQEVLIGVPQLMNAVYILAVSIVVNIGCVFTLFQIRRLDRQLIPRSEEPQAPVAHPANAGAATKA